MSRAKSPHKFSDENPIREIRDDEETRAGVEALAERDDILGALARVCLALADGERPALEDREEAGLESLELFFDGGNR